jgi:hypothetical protein
MDEADIHTAAFLQLRSMEPWDSGLEMAAECCCETLYTPQGVITYMTPMISVTTLLIPNNFRSRTITSYAFFTLLFICLRSTASPLPAFLSSEQRTLHCTTLIQRYDQFAL